MTHQEKYVYLEVVSASMKSQCYEIPDQASVLLTTTAPGFTFSKQSKSICHLDASTSKQWWMFKEVFELPAALKEQKLHIKLYGSSATSASAKEAMSATSITKKLQPNDVKLKIPAGNNSRLERCIGKLDLTLSSLQGSTATTVDLNPVSLASQADKDKSVNILKRSVISTITLRVLNDPPPMPPSSTVLDTVAVREKTETDPDQANDETLLGTVRLVAWQGKNLNTDYPVFLDTRMNQKTVRRYCTLPVANPHNPIFDVIQDFDIVSLQGDLFITVVTAHSLRSNKPLGQVVIPLSMLTKNMVEYETSVSISGWFELFPFSKITKYNGGGKYVPFMQDIPLNPGLDNCIGLAIPDKPIGFIKIDVKLQLYHSLIYTILRNPFCVEEKPQVTGVDDDDALDLFDIYVTKHNFYRIMDTLTNPLWFKTFKDIIRWNHHFGVTFFALYLYGYTCLLAEVWMFPVLFVMFVIFVGFVGSYERHFHKNKLFVDEKQQQTKQQKAEEGNSKSLAERYKGLKQSVYKMEQKVRQLASQVEKVNNLLLWSDPTLSITALFFLLAATLAASILLSIVPFNLCFFFGGLVVFIPQEAMGRLKKIKRMSKLLWQRAKAEYRIHYDKKLPEGTFLTRLRQTHLEDTMTGHILSGDLCSQTWSGTVPVSCTASSSANRDPSGCDTGSDGGDGGDVRLNTSKWTRKWCELWAVPGVLAIQNDLTSGGGMKPELYDVTYVKAEYIGKSSKAPLSDVTLTDSANDLFLFEILYLEGKKAKALRQVVWPNYETRGWVFACSSFGDAQTWVKAINRVSYRRTFTSILSGEDFHNPFARRVNRGLLSVIMKTLWRWVMLVPDNLELQHRHFCDQAYVRTKNNFYAKASSLWGKTPEQMNNNDLDVIKVSAKNFTGSTEAVRYLSVGHDMRDVVDGDPMHAEGIESTASSGIHVSLFRARGLPVKHTQTKAKGWLLASTIPKIYVNLSLSSKKEDTPLDGVVLRTGGQPRSSEPVFREDFFFPVMDYDVLLKKKVYLQLEVSVRTPMAFGLSSDQVQILGRVQIPLQPWVKQKLGDDANATSDSGEARNGKGGTDLAGKALSDNAKRMSEAEILEEEKWYNIISHTVAVGELKMQIACL